MRKVFTILSVWLCAASSLFAQTLLSERFEDTTVFPPQGWSVINDTQPGAVKHWEATTSALAGKGSVWCDAGTWLGDGEPVKEEWLITPELSLSDDSYKLEFKWKGATAASLDKKEYDFQVRVQKEGSEDWETIFSFLNQEDIENSGLLFPWPAWTVNTSVLDLSQFRGQKIKIAFVHCLLIGGLGKGNAIWLDDVLVERYEPITSPVVGGTDMFVFNPIYIGADAYSDPMVIRNDGKGILEVTGISGLEGTDFSTNLVPGEVSLKQLAEYEYNVIYTPTLTGSPTATMVVHTNGGDLTVQLAGSKNMLPVGYTYEGFEGETFPPVGWSLSASGDWTRANGGLCGLHSASSIFASNGTLTSPRLDLSDPSVEYFVEYGFMEVFESMSDDGGVPSNEMRVYFSSNGGATWARIDTTNMIFNEPTIYKKVLNGNGSDNCYVKWVYEMDPDASAESAEYSYIYLDNVVLPNYYGASSVPAVASEPSPATGKVNVFNENVVLSWRPAQFAKGYKLYVGKSNTDFSIVPGTDLGEATTYKLDLLDYATTYYWKVVPYNDKGEAAGVPVWTFTTIEDHSVSTFPYKESFEDSKANFPPLGWTSERDNYTRWDYSNYNAYEGSFVAMISGNGNNETGILQTATFHFPADEVMQISFYWGNAVPASLVKKAPAKEAAAEGADIIYFEIYADGQWTELKSLSVSDETRYWERERIVLSDYVGKDVRFRWRYYVKSGMSARGAALDNIIIEAAAVSSGKASLNITSWDAGTVNYKHSVSSGDKFILLNDGEQTMKIKEVKFNTENFTTSLNVGYELATRESVAFSVTFNAGETNAPVSDVMTISFENSDPVTMELSGLALDRYTRYFGFDEDEFASTSPNGFTTIDVDALATVEPVMIYYPNRGTAYAYIVMNQIEADWRNIYPRSGDQMLAAMVPSKEGYSSDDWLISEKMVARSDAKFYFYAKSYGSEDQFKYSNVTVWVSTTDNVKTSFVKTTLASVDVPHINNSNNENFTKFEVDLSAYSGQAIYVALQCVTPSDGFVTFFDDFFFEGFEFDVPGNQAPVFVTEAPSRAVVNEPFVYNFSVNDPDGDALTIKTVGLPKWISETIGATGGVLSGTPTEEGVYMFRIEASDGQLSAQQLIELNVNGSGIDGVDVNAIKVYPNPVVDYIRIEGEQIAEVSVFDASGKQLMQTADTTIDMTSLADGFYFVKVKTAAATYTVRIIKK